MEKTPKLTTRRRLDWIRIAFILEEKGMMSLDQLSDTYNSMFKFSKSNREVSRIINCYRRYGFIHHKQKSIKIYKFNGTLPNIHPRTLERWKDKIQSL